MHGPRIEIRLGLPILTHSDSLLQDLRRPKPRFSTMPALIDTGAQRTVVSPEAVRSVGLSKINEADLRRAGGVSRVDVYVASMAFPRSAFSPIEVMEVSCCDLPLPTIQCLLGRDVLSRWIFTYDGPAGTWEIREQHVPGWLEPPEGNDLWGG